MTLIYGFQHDERIDVDRYGITLGKKPVSILDLEYERAEVLKPVEEKGSFCILCGHGKIFCGKVIDLEETITRGPMTWNASWGIRFQCTRERGHKGPHVACSYTVKEHGLKVWD